MKKITSIALVALLAVGFTSCKKEYTCSCNNTATKSSVDVWTQKLKKSDAEAACKAAGTIIFDGCKLK